MGPRRESCLEADYPSVKNEADFAQLFEQWAATTAKGLEDIVELGKIPEDLKPQQRL